MFDIVENCLKQETLFIKGLRLDQPRLLDKIDSFSCELRSFVPDTPNRTAQVSFFSFSTHIGTSELWRTTMTDTTSCEEKNERIRHDAGVLRKCPRNAR